MKIYIITIGSSVYNAYSTKELAEKSFDVCVDMTDADVTLLVCDDEEHTCLPLFKTNRRAKKAGSVYDRQSDSYGF